MKMTDEQMQELAPGEYTDWEKRVWRRGYDDARLAADQQKGGGEEAVDLSAALRKVRNRASEPGTSAHHGEQFVSGMRCAANMLENMSIVKTVYTTPQPSIPAPAQQGPVVGGGVVLPRYFLDFLLGQGTLEGFWFSDKPAAEPGAFWWRDRLRALARPPHADQETQG